MAGSRRPSYRYGASSGSGSRLVAYARLPSGSSGGGGPPRITRERAMRMLQGALIVLPWSVLLLLLAVHQLRWWSRQAPQLPQVTLPGARECVGWRETIYCHPFAERYASGDKSCDAEIIPQISGYCLCEGNVTTARVTCGPKKFTCRQKCAELAYNPTDALMLPTPITCPYEVPYLLEDFLQGIKPIPENWGIDAAAERGKVEPIWESVFTAVHTYDISNATVPSTRNDTHDFVREGQGIPTSTVSYVRSRLQAYSAALPTYARDVYSGRGVVTVGGGMRYIIPAWIMVHQLRHQGCRLPIEMWFPPAEWPPQAVVDAFSKLGVTSRKMDFRGVNITSFKDSATLKSFDPNDMGRFAIKVAALVLSKFEEIIYLDADNIPLRDPSFLFDTKEYNATGALLWQDFWANTVAPQAEQMLGVPRSDWFAGSFESGQMVLNKRRHWRGLLTAAWLNAHAKFWYEVFTCFLGKGDKETFAYGMVAVKEGFSVVTAPPASLGTAGTSMACSKRTHLCHNEFTGNTMVQYDPSGAPLFLHSNLHKWDMRLPEKFSLHYQRRWQVMMPGRVRWEEWMQNNLGYDLELKVYEWIRMLRCMPWWDAYYQERVALGDRKTPELDGFHYLLRGIELPRLYRAGWSGNYQRILEDLSMTDHWLHSWNAAARPRLAALGLVKRWSIEADTPS